MELVTLLLEKRFSDELKEMVRRKTNKKGMTLEDSIMHILREFHKLHKDLNVSIEKEFEHIENLLNKAERCIMNFGDESKNTENISNLTLKRYDL